MKIKHYSDTLRRDEKFGSFFWWCHLFQLLPTRIDWEGQEHVRSFENLVSAIKL